MDFSFRKLCALVLVNLISFSVMFAIGEFAMRWHLEGGAGAALRSFTSSASGGFQGTRGWLVHDAVLGYTLNPASPGINSLGIRHAEIGTKPQGVFRVIVLGDSVAWDADGFVTRLGRDFGRIHQGQVDLINASIPGYTTYQERALLEKSLLAVKPDLVILEYCLNDNHRFLHMLNNAGTWLLTPEAERALAAEGNGPISRFMRSSYLLLEIRLRLLSLQFFSRRGFPWDARADFSPAWQDRTWPDIERHLQAIRDELAAIGARFAVVAVPYEPQLQQALIERDHDYTQKPQRKLTDICTRLGVPFLDLYPAFLANRNQALYRDGIHLTERGHALAEGQLLKFLEKEKLATWQ